MLFVNDDLGVVVILYLWPALALKELSRMIGEYCRFGLAPQPPPYIYGMPHCTRQGCKKEYNEEENEEGACLYHSGAPVSVRRSLSNPCQLCLHSGVSRRAQVLVLL